MTFSIIPEYSDMQSTLALITEYGANLEYNDFWNPSVYSDEAEVEKRIRYYTGIDRDRSGDTMHGAFLGLDLAAADPVIRDRSRRLYEQSLEIGARLGVKGVVFHTGLIGELRLDYYIDHWLEESADFWREKCSRYPDLTIYMENSFEQQPDVFVALMERMKGVDNFRLCLDYGHAVLTQTPIEQWCRALAPYVGHMHLNDNDLKDDLHLVPGCGKIDFNKWKTLMDENGIDTSVLLEISGCENAGKALKFMRGTYDKQ